VPFRNTGSAHSAALKWVRSQIEQAKNACKPVDIDLFGYSRGAIFAIEITQELSPQHIRFLGIIDSVSRGLMGQPETEQVPDTVGTVYEAMRARDVTPGDRTLFPITPVTHENHIMHTHRFNDDHVRIGLTDPEVLQWMQTVANSNGVPIDAPKRPAP